jgi:hypothetical protein
LLGALRRVCAIWRRARWHTWIEVGIEVGIEADSSFEIDNGSIDNLEGLDMPRGPGA